MIRKPIEIESLDCIKLLYMSGPSMFRYFLIDGEPEIYKYIKMFYTKPDILFSKEYCYVKIDNGKVCGLLHAMSITEMKQMEKNMFKYGKDFFNTMGFTNLMKILFRSGINKYLSVLYKEDEYYISNLAVFEVCRGKGFCLELLQKAEELAKENGYKKLSLCVELYNGNAKRIYEKFGFCPTEKVELPSKYHKYSIDGFYKMVKMLDLG